ncbi:MAG: hypothetical protein H9533_10060 [Rhodobacteraceae bacterium]|nr:hypothetical protein [Paracoccaceae bacterium]
MTRSLPKSPIPRPVTRRPSKARRAKGRVRLFDREPRPVPIRRRTGFQRNPSTARRDLR